MNIGDVVVASI